MRPEIFAGTTVECLADFGQRFSLEQFPESRRLLADFAGVKEASVYRWVTKRGQPVGAGLVKARCFLEAAGYKVKELESMPEKNKILARLIAFDLIDVQTMAMTFGYIHDQQVFHLVSRGGGVNSDRDTTMNQLIKEHETELEKAMGRLEASLAEELKINGAPPAPRPIPEPEPTPEPAPGPRLTPSGRVTFLEDSLERIVDAYIDNLKAVGELSRLFSTEADVLLPLLFSKVSQEAVKSVLTDIYRLLDLHASIKRVNN